MFAKKIKNKKGFTLIELMASMTIIGIITTISIVNYKKGGRINDLLGATQEVVSEIRLVQSYALSSKEFDGDFWAGGWGIRLQEGSSEIVIFVDKVEDQKFRQNNSNGELYLKKTFSLTGDVFVSSIEPSATNHDNLYLVYSPPDPTIYVGVSDNANNTHVTNHPSAVVTFSNKSGDTKTMTINSFGLIDVD